MSQTESILEPALRDLVDALDDFSRASFQNADSVLSRFIYVLDSEPLAGFLNAVLSPVDFDAWWAQAKATGGSMVGSGSLHWPADRAERVALQTTLCRQIANSKISFINFTHQYCYPGYNSLSAHVQKFAEVILHPLTRDIERLTEHRPLPPFLIDAMGRLPTSGDATLDALLGDATRKFRDSAPTSRQDAVERLWDAWERLKSLEAANDKRLSVQILLDGVTTEPSFRKLIETEARALTEIGNQFLIRHFESNRTPIAKDEHFDYLFHRLFALIHLLLFSRTGGSEA